VNAPAQNGLKVTNAYFYFRYATVVKVKTASQVANPQVVEIKALPGHLGQSFPRRVARFFRRE
jgi:hypothetical protein